MTVQPPAAPAPRQSVRRPGRAIALGTGVLALMCATAGATYVLTNRPPTPSGTTATATTTATTEPASSSAESLCSIFKETTFERGTAGGLRHTPTEPNMPVVLRVLASVVGVQQEMSNPSLPKDISDAAQTYATLKLRLVNAALSPAVPVAELNDLTTESNAASKELARACGL